MKSACKKPCLVKEKGKVFVFLFWLEIVLAAMLMYKFVNKDSLMRVIY
jgi:hypothetical protein